MAQALDDLLEALEDVDDATREEASKALAELGDPTTLDALVGACEDEYWAVRAHAGRAVARIGGAKAVEALIILFNDSIMDVRNDAVVAMASVACPRTCGENLWGNKGSESGRGPHARLSRSRWRSEECGGRGAGQDRRCEGDPGPAQTLP